MDHAGTVATEALIVSIAQRYLQSRFPKLKTQRGDGSVVFQFPPLKDFAQLSDIVERMVIAFVKELTGRTKVRFLGETKESDFQQIKSQADSFNAFMERLGTDALPDLAALPSHPTVTSMMTLLYQDAVAETPGLFSITNFPQALCPTGSRFDVSMRRTLCVSAFSSVPQDNDEENDKLARTDSFLAPLDGKHDQANQLQASVVLEGPTGKVVIDTRSIAAILAPHSAAPVEQVLPIQWRHKSFSLQEAGEVLSLVYKALMEFWETNTHTDKVKINALSLLAIVAGDVRDYCKEQILLESSDFHGPWRMPRHIIDKALETCRLWQQYCRQLVETDWTDWDGSHFHDESFDAFINRLKDVATIRSLMESASALSTVPFSLQPEHIFDNCSLTDAKVTPQAKWDDCVKTFEHEFSLVEDILRGRVRKIIESASGDAQVRLVQQYATLIRRATIMPALGEELETVATHLLHKLDAAKQRFTSAVRSVNGTGGSFDVQRIRMAKACLTSCGPIVERGRIVFGHSSPLQKRIEEMALNIVKLTSEEESKAIDSWRVSTESRATKIANLDRAVVVTAEGTDYMTCAVDESIAELVMEVNNIRCLVIGNTADLSSSCERTLQTCEKVLQVSIRTQQLVAAFNNVQRQVLPPCRGMLDALNVNCIQQICGSGGKARVIPFSNYSELEALNQRFFSSLESLSNENRHIRRFHADFINQVINLHSVDLLKNMDQWRAIADSMRTSFEAFIKTQQLQNWDRWRRHWDGQLYKALECQYRKGLENLHENMQEFKVELVFKQGQVQFRPSFEAMREAYYVKVREFVSVPQRFRGMQAKREAGDAAPYEYFPLMPAANADRITTVHTKAMELFAKLNKVRKAFRDYVAVGVCGTNGAPDLDAIVDLAVTELPQWVEGFKLIKERLKRTGLIEEQIKVDCFTVGTAPMKAAIEGQLRKLEDSLVHSLRKAMQQRLSKIDDFVLFASNIIERQPTTLDEVGRANKAFHQFQEQLPMFEASFKEVDEMNKVLRSVSGAAMEMNLTKSRWEHLMDAMASHHKIIEASVSKMRVSIDSMIQKYFKDLQRFANAWAKNKPNSLGMFKNRQEFIEKGLNYVKEQVQLLGEHVAAGREIEAKCDYFKLPPPDLSLLDDTARDIDTHHVMWLLYEQFESSLDKLRLEDWLTFRSHIYLFEDFVKEWKEQIASKLSEAVDGKSNIVLAYLSKMLDEWAGAVPLLKFVRGEGMMHEHWGEMFRLLEIEKGMTSEKLTFGDILSKHTQLVAKEKEIKHLHSRAQGEIQIRDALQDLRTWALEAVFTLVMPQDSTSKVQLITEWKDVMTQVSDNQALLGSLKDSPYFPRFADEAQGWEAKLLAVHEYLVLLNGIQRKWAYLEPLFARGALPNEQPRFKRVDKEFVSVLREVETDPRIMSLATHMDYSEKLKSILEQMDRCQKALNEFLEQKRDKFPRFYFISDEDLLEILGQSKNPAIIQAHLKKLFMGIHSVLFNEKRTAITHMVSSDGEQVRLKQEVGITDNNVEDWLIRLDHAMRESLRDLLKTCLARQDATSAEVIASFPSQILQVAEQIFFAQMVDKAIPSGDLNNTLVSMQKKLQTLTSTSFGDSVVTELKVKALILDVIHSIEVVELLIAKKTRSASDWWWQKQLRYYSDNEKGCILRMVDTSFAYTYEYQGNAAKLVHTPLTDKCYLVLTKGMHLGYGGNPYGPAGTGKTESVKALGSAMGRQVLVFNCDEGIDFKAMGRIFVGIVKCGAWGCFDEFNRLKVDQLSAISQMIQVIQEALKNNEANCTLLNRMIDVNPNSGIFVTLNPAGKGYGGRSKLPDNLKQLFRDVAMSVPDNELITATMLLSEGFTHAKTISKRVVEVYKLSKQLMSQQQHYDWGLRPLKAVLRLGGTLVQQWRRDNKGQSATEQHECELMVQSLRINTLSKLTFDDARLFHGIVGDIFPGTAIREISYKDLEGAIRSAVEALSLQHSPVQLHKTLQLYEAMNQRMGVVLVGPSGSGKSTLLKILRKALQILGVQVPQHTMNPKALPRQQLLGYMDPDTREWYDGVLSAAARRVVKEPSEVKSWIFCDGDIDPEWVESLNSVLDDNKLLTMPNGVRIQFGSNVNFVFETHSLEFASPATVSRMGIIFLSEEDVDLTFHITSFLAAQPQDVRDRVAGWVQNVVPKAVELAHTSGALVIPTTPMGLLNAALNHTVDAVNALDFATSLLRALSATMLPSAHADFATKVFDLTKQKPMNANKPMLTYVNRATGQAQEFAPSGGSALKGLTHEDLRGRERVVVPTIETELLRTTLAPLLQRNEPFLLVGPEGAGKSLTLSTCFQSERSSRVSIVHCSAQTSAQHLIQKLTQLCSAFSTNTGKVLRPKEGEKLVVVLKDLNLPKPDKYGTVQLHSFLQQLLLYRGFYDDELEWVGIERIQIAASMNPEVSAGRYPVSPRLLAIMNIVYVNYPSKESLQSVYGAYFGLVLKAPQFADGPDYEGGALLANFALVVFEKIKRRFEGEEHAHCVFCPRDIIAMIVNVLSYSADNVPIAALLAYEANRLFSDRLSRPEDRSRAEKIFIEQLATIGFAVNKDDKDKTAYVSWASDWNPATGARQLALRTYDDIEREVKSGLVRYGREVRELNVPLIPEAVNWITRVDRVLSKPGGHLLLVGRSGVGRRAAATIAAYLIRIDVVVLNMTRDYNLKSFRTDLRTVMQRVGTQNERVMLMVEDHNFTSEAFLEMLNSLVSSGEVPGLFTPEEMESMLMPLRDEASSEGYMGTISSYFLRRVFHNLRVCIIMDPKNDLFRARCQANPGLLTCCSVLWMGTWTSDGTRSICKQTLRDVIKQLEGSEGGKGFALHRELYAIHESLGQRATPRLFQTLLETYQKIYTQKDKASSNGLARLEAGLTKLLEAEANVSNIREDVGAKKVSMERMQLEADNALTEIQKSMEDSKEQRDRAEELTARLAEEQKEIVVKKAKVENELSGIQPTLDAAKEAVSGIKSESLNEIRVLKSPPEPIRDVLEGVLALLGISDVSWQSMRKFLSERGAKERILEFDAHSVTPSIRDNVSKLLIQKAQSFKHENIVRASVAAAPMAAWVKANVDYATILERIGPLQSQLDELVLNKKDGEEKLDKLKKKLKKIDERVEQLRKEFSQKCKDAERLKDKLEKAEKDLAAAEDLLEKLSGEKTRWSNDAKNIKETFLMMPKRAVIAAAFLTYLAKESEDMRLKYIQQWAQKMNMAGPSSVASFMRTESELLQYKTEGLPSDELSQENAVVILDTVQTPLVVDPANQAVQWLKAHLKSNDVTVETTSMHDDRFAHTLELAIRFGKTLLVTEVDRVDAMLFPVLRRDLISQGPKRVVTLGNKLVDWQDTFRLFLFTRSTDLQLTPDSSSLVVEVNFSVTRQGLESQLLGNTIQHEKPELEMLKVELLQKEENLKVQLAKLEETLLADLASSHGNLLENAQLVQSLNLIKSQAFTIGESLEQSTSLQAELDAKREVYREFARKGSVMFFLIQDMELGNHMYQFSLEDFLSIFQMTLTNYDGDADLDFKIPALSLSLAQQSFLHVSSGLFKADRIEFAMHVAHGYFPGDFPEAHWRVLIGTSEPGDIEGAARQLPTWSQPSAKRMYAALLAVEPGAPQRLQLQNQQFWEQWVRSAAPEKGLANYTSIDLLILVGMFRPDRLAAAMSDVALQLLKLNALVEVVPMEVRAQKAKAESPILFITSAGADPSMEVQDVAYKVVGRSRFTQVALGGGQTDEAMTQLRRCAASGEWLFLKNLHLVLGWVAALENEINSMGKPHKDFRLFLTTEAHDAFPSVLLKTCVKVTVEAPPGVKQNLLRTYGGWDEAFLNQRSVPQAQILFGLAWFHALVQERRTYIPQGWVKHYDFTQADLKSAADIIRAMADQGGTADWVTIRGLLESAIYGGRLDNLQDIKVLVVLLEKVFNAESLVSRQTALHQSIGVPATNRSAEVSAMVMSSLPDADAPAIFSLPDNADRVVQEHNAALHLEHLKAFAQHQAQSEASADAWRALLVPIVERWTQTAIATPANIATIPPSVENPDPLEVFFVSEVWLIAKVIKQTASFFADLKRVADGVLIPSDSLRRDAADLIGGHVPELWLDRMDGARDLHMWLITLKAKSMAIFRMQSDIASRGAATILQQVNLKDFLRPQTFLNALRQYTARKTKEPLVDLVLAAYMSGAVGASGGVTATIKGDSLLIQGAAPRGSNAIGAVDNNAASSTPFVDVQLSWVRSDKFSTAAYASIPLYSNAQREVHIMDVQVPCSNPTDRNQWILGGVALLLM